LRHYQIAIAIAVAFDTLAAGYGNPARKKRPRHNAGVKLAVLATRVDAGRQVVEQLQIEFAPGKFRG
jgi:hypothetical protein